MPNSKKVLILNYTGDRVNWGCCATSDGLKELLSPKSNNIEIDVIPLLDQDQYDEILDVLYGAFSRRAMSSNTIKTNAKNRLLKLAIKRFGNESINKIEQADIIIFQAEGTMTGQSFYAGARLLLLPFIAKQVFTKPVISINQTVFSANPDFTPLIKNVYEGFDAIILREASSFQFAKEMGLDNCVLIPDAAFLTDITNIDLPDQVKNLNYFTVTGAAKINTQPIERYCHLVFDISAKFKLVPVFLLSTPADELIIKEFRKLYPDQKVIQFGKDMSYRQVTKIMSKANFLIGGRYHMCCLSAVSGTPYLAFNSNTFKNNGLNALLGYNVKVFDFVTENDEILDWVNSLLSNKEFYDNNITTGLRAAHNSLDVAKRAISEIFNLDVVTKKDINKIFEKTEFSLLRPEQLNIQITDDQWKFFYNINKQSIETTNKLVLLAKKFPFMFFLVKYVKYFIKELIYRHSNKT